MVTEKHIAYDSKTDGPERPPALILQPNPKTVSTPELRFECDDHRKFKVIEEVAARLRKEGADVSEIDGVRVNTPDGWWLLRASNTQAVLVARAEGRIEACLERLKEALVQQLELSGLPRPDFSGASSGH